MEGFCDLDVCIVEGWERVREIDKVALYMLKEEGDGELGDRLYTSDVFLLRVGEG